MVFIMDNLKMDETFGYPHDETENTTWMIFHNETWKISPVFFHDWAAGLQGKLIGMATKIRGKNMFQHVNMLTSATKMLLYVAKPAIKNSVVPIKR